MSRSRDRAADAPQRLPETEAPGLDDLDLDAFLPYRLAVLTARVSRSLSHVYARRFRLSVPEWRIIANLGRMGPLGAGELAERSSLEKPKLSRAIQRLEARGLAARSTDRDDRRRATLALTAEGRRMFRAIVPAALAWEAAWLETLSPGERSTFAALLTKLESRLDGPDADA